MYIHMYLRRHVYEYKMFLFVSALLSTTRKVTFLCRCEFTIVQCSWLRADQKYVVLISSVFLYVCTRMCVQRSRYKLYLISRIIIIIFYSSFYDRYTTTTTQRVYVYICIKTKRYFSPTIARKCPASINIYMHKNARILYYIA